MTVYGKKLKNIDKGMKSVEKNLLLSNIGLRFSTAGGKVLNNFKSRLFPIQKLEAEPLSELEKES